MSGTKGGSTITLDPSEVKRYFTGLDSWDSERDTDDPRLRELNRRQRLDLPEYLTIADSIMLDVGCGDGRITEDMAKLGASHVVGVDLSHNVLSKARERLGDTPSHFVRSDVDQLPFRAHIFDAATFLDALVHMPDPKHALTELSRTLSQGGALAVNMTNSNPFWRLTVQGSPWKLIRDTFLYHFPASIVRPIMSVLGRRMTGRHLSEVKFRAIVEDQLELTEFLSYGGAPPVYYVAIAMKPLEAGSDA